MDSRSKDNQRIFDEAAEWFVEFREDQVDPQVRTQFARWVRQSPEHIRAYLEVAAFWADVPSFVSKDDVDIQALIDFARAEENIVQLEPFRQLSASEEKLQLQIASKLTTHAASALQPEHPRVWSRSDRTGPITASVALLCVVSTAAIYSHLESGTYTTEVGEQRSIILEDGSNVELNARSRLRVRFEKRSRRVELLEGEALFHVAADKTRPFTVAVGDTQVRAVGTLFDVYRKNSGTTVSVVEGRVAVLLAKPVTYGTGDTQQPLAGASTTDRSSRDTVLLDAQNKQDVHSGVLLSAGDQVIVTAQAAVRPSRTDVPGVTAWTQRQIVFHGSSLSEVCEQFNRYNRKQLVIDAPELRTVRVSGVFSTTDPTSLLRFLREQIQLDMTEKDGRIVISRK